MNRRQFVSAAVPSLALAGCVEGEPPGGESESPSPSDARTDGATETGTATDEGTASTATPESCWPRMCAGTPIVIVEVAGSFSGDVVLEADCREADVTVESGETASVERREEAESCSARVLVDDEVAFDEGIPGYQRTTVTVAGNGDVETESIVL